MPAHLSLTNGIAVPAADRGGSGRPGTSSGGTAARRADLWRVSHQGGRLAAPYRRGRFPGPHPCRGGGWDSRRQERPQWVLHAAVNNRPAGSTSLAEPWNPGLVRGSAAYRPLNSPALCVTWIMDDAPSPACHSSLGRGRRPVFRKCRTRPSGCLREMSRLLQGLRRCLCTADDGKTPGNGPAGAGLACRESCIGSHSVQVKVMVVDPVIGCGMPYARKPGACNIKASSGPRQLQSRDNRVVCLGPDFFVHGTVQARRLGHRTVRTPGEFLSHRDLPSMTGYRVRRLRR